MRTPTDEAKEVFDNLPADYKFLIRVKQIGDFTCADCPIVKLCDLAFDLYNTQGDCLLLK